MTLPSDLVELAHHLKQENLFVVAQRGNIQKAFEDVRKYSDELFHQSWIARQQRSCMYKLLFASNTSPKEVCGHNNQLELTNFVDGYKFLGYQDSKYGEFLKILRENPVYLANCIDNGEKGGSENTQEVLKIIMSAVFGNVVLHEDENLALQMIKSLAELQLANSDDPRRLIRKGTCGFRLMFLQLFDCLFSAKLFLTAALHEAVMKLMMEDEWFYDIDPRKALVRFPTAERQKRFGREGTQQYEDKCQEYRKFIVDKLVVLTNRFVSALKNNMHCFPPALGWLISHVYHILLKTGKHDVDKIRVICVDLVYTLFVCPAICDPEPYGITSDIHISHIARHNLMQIAQIIQVLAVSQWEEDSKEKDLYERFEKGCVSSLLDSILQTCGSELPNYSHGNRLQILSRSSTLITVSQLNTLVSYFRNIIQNGEDDSPEIKLIDEVLNGLPPLINNSGQNGQSCTLVSTPPGTPSSQRKAEKKKEKELMKLKKNKDDSNATQIEDVIVISLGNDVDCPGMLSEQKVLSWEQENKRRKVTYHEGISNYAEPGEKRTRFSLSQDQESIGNTSDLQEAISEGASSHSVGSVDLENDDDPDDNFSDMISANVSGRGTPNISGRDTPPSPAGSVEAPVHQLQQENIQPIQLPVTVPKSNGEDVTDRFGKFEIKKEFVPVDETKSTVSDTWSTDVLASDSEPPEQNQFDRLEEIGEEIVRQNLLARNEPLSELSETASDAWSTDVLASDNEEKQTEELSEFDQDDIGSVITDVSSISGDPGNIEMHEDTPLASGQETPENLLLDPFGATGSATNSSGATQNKSNKNSDAKLPSAEASVSFADFPNYFHDNDSYRHGPTESRSANTGSFASNIKKKKQKTVQMNVDNVIDSDEKRKESNGDSNKLSLPSASKHTRVQQKIKNTPGNLTLPVPDTNVRTVQSENLGNANGDLIKLTAHGARPKVLQRATYPLCDNQNNSEEVIPVERRGKISNIEANSVDSGIGGTPRSEIDSLNEQTGNIKISEQQNTKFDANRLSLALSMFDPISNENADEDQKLISLDDSAENNPTILRAMVDKGNNSAKSKRETVIIGETMFPNPRKSSNPIDIVLGLNADYTDDRRESNDSSSAGSGNSGDEVPFAKSSRSASFDNISQKLEEKGTVELDPDESGKTPTKTRSLFKSFREKVTRSGKKIREKSMILKSDSVDSTGASGLFYDELPQKPEAAKEEKSYDILDKYRTKPASAIANSVEGNSTDSSIPHPVKEKRLSIKEESQPYYDPNNLENCVLFLDAKRKLRLVLSNCDCDIGQNVLDFGFSYIPSSPKDVDSHRENNELLLLLRSQLAEAINLQNKESIAQLHEAIRCVKLFDARGCKKLVNVLKDEHQTRTAYISYLIRCQQGLLATQSYVQRLLSRVQRDKSVCNKHLVNVCVRLFIESKEGYVVNFIQEFQKLIVSDEKTDLVERFLQFLYQQMNQNPIWQASTENQMDDARLSIERYLMSRIYTHAMFPNGDGDINRDQILHQHIKKLAQLVTPNHKSLQIPKIYQFECPWTAAQREIYMVNAYKTPKDKLKCVHRCSATIMNLLSMANDKSVPAADEFMPVLIFVIIKANPPCLLSTVQYVNSFYGNRLQGEEQYWWMQFSSVVEFIKTMDYTD